MTHPRVGSIAPPASLCLRLSPRHYRHKVFYKLPSPPNAFLSIYIFLPFRHQGVRSTLWSARYPRICVGGTSVAFRWKCSTTASNWKTRTEAVRDLGPDRGARLLAAGTLWAPVGPRQYLTRVILALMMQAEAGRPRLIASAPAIDL